MPRYGAYDKNDNHTYAIGVFPSMELLAARPESVRCLLVSPAGYQNAGVNKLIVHERAGGGSAPRGGAHIGQGEQLGCDGAEQVRLLT